MWMGSHGVVCGLTSGHTDSGLVLIQHHSHRLEAGLTRALSTEAIGGAAAGRKRKMYPWGNALTPDGTHRANVWQGAFPTSNSVEDGYAGVAPVLAFGPQNGLGMYRT